MESTSVVPVAHTIAAAARLVGCSVSTLYRAAEEGRLDIVKLGNRSLIPDTSLRAMVAALPKLKIRRAGKRRAA